MRPKIEGLFDSEIRLWRPSVTKDKVAQESRTYSQLTTVGAVINRSQTPVVPADGGLAPTGAVRWYGKPTIDVQIRDICEVISGPDAGALWEVNQIPVRPRGHHTQVDCIDFHGVLTPEES
jgi:hypothetical protein